VCRKAYIDPCVFVAWEDGRLQKVAGSARGERQWEQAALKLMAKVHRVSLRKAKRAAEA
jgi:DNA topoisomerase IB